MFHFSFYKEISNSLYLFQPYYISSTLKHDMSLSDSNEQSGTFGFRLEYLCSLTKGLLIDMSLFRAAGHWTQLGFALFPSIMTIDHLFNHSWIVHNIRAFSSFRAKHGTPLVCIKSSLQMFYPGRTQSF